MAISGGITSLPGLGTYSYHIQSIYAFVYRVESLEE